MAIFTGAGVALVTPFLDGGTIDFDTLGELVEWQIAEGTDAIVVCGTTGEPVTMTEEERTACISFVVEKTAHRVPVIAGTGGNCTRTVVEASKNAQALGVDALLVVTPYYNKATQEGLVCHYKAVAEAVTIPIIMYNVPSRTGVNILPETAVRIARECPNVRAIKEASGNISQVAELAALSEGLLDIYSGNDDQIIPILSLGGKGVISVLSNVRPNETHRMVTEYLNGNREQALSLQLSLLPLIKALFLEVNPIPVKEALNLMGYRAGAPRLPLTPLAGKNREKLREALIGV